MIDLKINDRLRLHVTTTSGSDGRTFENVTSVVTTVSSVLMMNCRGRADYDDMMLWLMRDGEMLTEASGIQNPP